MMNMIMTQRTIQQISRQFMYSINLVHRRIFGTSMGERTHAFMRQAIYSICGGMGVFILLFAANVIAARTLGAEEYGRYAVFIAIAQILSMVYVMELDIAALYFLAGKKDVDHDTVSSIFVMYSVNVIMFSFLFWSIYLFFGISTFSVGAMVGVMGMAYIIGWKRFVDAFMRIKDLFGWQAIIRIAEGLVVLGIVVACVIYEGHMTHQMYIAALMCGSLLVIVWGGSLVGSMISWKAWNKERMNEIFRYNMHGYIGAFINGVIKNLDTVIIAAVLGTVAAGVYTAYFTASVVIGARITQLVVSVLFPSMRAHQDRLRSIIYKIDRFGLWMSMPLLVLSCGGVALIMLLYGTAYPFMWQWVILGGMYIVINFFVSIYEWILSSTSRKGYRLHNLSYVFGFVIYSLIIVSAFLMHELSITIFLGALITYRIVSGIIVRRSLHRYII